MSDNQNNPFQSTAIHCGLMIRKGYPGLGRDAQEQIALDSLLRTVGQELYIQCIMQGCHSLDQAVSIIQRYEAAAHPHTEAERKRKAVRAVADVTNPTVNKDKANATGDDLNTKLMSLLDQQTKLLQEM